ncbi:MAG: endonuclease III [Rhabdochlamydiaceae bacterium]|nr:endonuclease III [Candidatus Amphrikana amoebophyrae]
MSPKQIQSILEKEIPHLEIPLDHKDPYTLLVAVLLSAQCTDARVNLVTPALFALADNPKAMAQQNVSEIEDIIRPCGLAPTKSKAIFNLSKILVEKFNSIVPKTLPELESLPGVGHKTASVVLIQAFNIPAFPVDTHIWRCAKRWGLSEGKNVAQVERDLKALFPKESWARLHLQIILFARKYCPARNHNEKNCPICGYLKP